MFRMPPFIAAARKAEAEASDTVLETPGNRIPPFRFCFLTVNSTQDNTVFLYPAPGPRLVVIKAGDEAGPGWIFCLILRRIGAKF